MSNDKKKYGKFYTTNYKLILSDLSIPDNEKIIIEPFVGEGNLLEFINHDQSLKIETYDICQPVNDFTSENITFTKQDTLKDPPDYTNKFVITNPPYLARNKSTNKEIYNKYKTNDLFKCFLISLINDPPNGGIIIIPLNFFCSMRKQDIDLRNDFFLKFKILTLNIFKTQVFKDTSYQICSFSFCFRLNDQEKDKGDQKNYNNTIIDKIIFRNKENDKTITDISISKKDKWLIGGDIYTLDQDPDLLVYRYLVRHKHKNKKNNISKKQQCFYIETIDTKDNKIKLITNKNIFYGKDTSRTTASITTDIINLLVKDQNEICDIFNKILNEYREKYDSLFLTNYRDNNRKRISFTLVYTLINHSIIKWIRDNDHLLI